MAEIINSVSNHTVIGTATADYIVSTEDATHVTILARGGNDTVELKGSYTDVYTDTGTDVINNFAKHNIIHAGTSNDVVNNSAEYVTISGDYGNDTINNNANFVEIKAGSSSSIFNTGSQVAIEVDSGKSTVTNRGEYTRISGLDSCSPVIINQADANFSTIEGGDGNDSIVNYAYGVHIDGRDSNDTIENYGAKDVTIYGGDGNDVISNKVRASGVTLGGGGGNDVISLAGGDEVILFKDGDGNDTVYGFNEKTKLAFEYDSSSIVSHYDSSAAKYISDVILKVGSGSFTLKNTNSLQFYETITGTDGDDKITTSDSMKFISTGKGNDTVNLIMYNYVYIDGGSGNDYIWGLGGNNTAKGGAGDDTISMFLIGYHMLDGESGDDKISGGAHSTLYGGDGNDSLHADNNSYLEGGNGNDTLELLYGHSTAVGGKGDDLIIINNSSQGVHIVYNEGDGNDTLNVYNKGIAIDTDYDSIEQQGNDVLLKIGEGSLLIQNTTVEYFLTGQTGTEGDDTINNTVSQKNINALGGNDLITNSGSDLELNAGEGNDTVNNSGENVNIISGGGNDSINNSGYDVRIDSGGGDDTIGNSKRATINSGDGNDFVDNYASATINAGAGNDSVYSHSSYSVINGEDGDDVLHNGANNSTILGGNGQDNIVNSGSKVTINTGKGNDIVSINGGSGTFTFDSDGGNDTVYGYSNNNYSFVSGYDTLTQSGDNMIMSVGDANITFVNTHLYDFVEGKYFKVGSDNSYVKGTEGHDTINCWSVGRGSTIDALGGNDFIQNRESRVSISGGDGDDHIVNYGSRILLANHGVTINGGKGNDQIHFLDDQNEVVLQYEDGDGDDVVYGFGKKTTLKAYYDSATQSGNDVIVKIGEGSITFKDTSIGLFNVNGNHQLPAYDAIEELVEPTVDNLNDELTDILQPAAITDLGAIETPSNDFFKSVGNAIETKFADIVRRHNKN